MEEIKVEQDHGVRSATHPDWLTTTGVGPCIAVAIAADKQRKAWLIHSGVFAFETAQLEQMLADALAETGSASGLRVWAFGGGVAEASGAEELASQARGAAIDLISRHLPDATVDYQWKEVDFLEVRFEQHAWICTPT